MRTSFRLRSGSGCHVLPRTLSTTALPQGSCARTRRTVRARTVPCLVPRYTSCNLAIHPNHTPNTLLFPSSGLSSCTCIALRLPLWAIRIACGVLPSVPIGYLLPKLATCWINRVRMQKRRANQVRHTQGRMNSACARHAGRPRYDVHNALPSYVEARAPRAIQPQCAECATTANYL